MLVAPSVVSPTNTTTTTTSATSSSTSLAMKKSASDSNVVSAEVSCGARRSSNPGPGSSTHHLAGDSGGLRRSSDGDAISLLESDTDGLEAGPGSPLAFGLVDWTDTANSLAHVFVPTHSSIDNCHLQAECLHSGHR